VSLLKILNFPDKRLKEIAPEVTANTPELQTFIKDMFETMYAWDGVGLATTQVGSQYRLFVLDVSEHKNTPQCFINPIITAKSGTLASEEGCLSFPDIFVTVQRAEEISVSYLDENFQPRELECEDLLAICIQHEMDHLNGITFYDKLSSLKQERVKAKLFKQQAMAAKE
jgi:peptide deformylase